MISPYKSNQFRITSVVGYRTDPVTGKKSSPHYGLDCVAVGDDTVVAVASGTVIQSRILYTTATAEWGNYIAIQDSAGYTTYYCHLAKRLVSKGDKVVAGQPIGVEGATGKVTGKHLHIELRKGTKKCNLDGGMTECNIATYLGVNNMVGTYTVKDCDISIARPSRYTKNGFEIVEATNFAVKYHDANKRTGGYNRYVNGGFFATYKNPEGVYFTLPVGNLVCDIGMIPFAARKYIGQHIVNGKLRYDCDENQSNQFHGKNVATLIVPASGKPYISDVNKVPADAKYAISGVPTVRNGDDVDYYNYVQKQGWDTSCMYATSRSWLGVRDGKIWLITGKTSTANYIYGMEFWKKIRDEQFDDIICIDGGGSYYWKNGKTIKTTLGSRQVNTIIVI